MARGFRYEVLLTFEVVEELPRNKTKRDFLLSSVKTLETGHNWEGEYKIFSKARNIDLEVSQFKNYKVFWMVDHPVKQVQVIKIQQG